MPQLGEQRFNQVLQRVMASAPAGLSEAEFNALLDAEVAKEEAVSDLRPMASHGPEPEARGSSRLATLGGMAGSLMGGSRATPMGVAMAGAGGAAGQAQTELMEGAREPYQAAGGGGFVPRMPTLSFQPGALTRIAQAGGEQAVAEGVGRGIMGGLTRGGKSLYTRLLKPKDATVENFPNVVEDLIKDRRLITPGSRAKALAAQKATGAEKGGILARADATGRTVPRETLRSGLDEVLTKAMASSEQPAADLGALAKLEKKLLPDEAELLPSRADAIKSQLQSKAARGYRQTKMGTRVNDLPMEARMAMAGKAKGGVEEVAEGILSPSGKSLRDVNARYASLKGQTKALRDATKREGSTHVIGMRDLIGAGTGGALGYLGDDTGTGAATGVGISRLLTTPRSGSAVAIGLNELGRIPYSQLLRMLEQALQEQQEEE
jgi:hypothetical protein